MKINLLLDNKEDLLAGYTNVDPFSKEGEACDVNNLDKIVDDGEAVEIRANEILCYFNRPDMQFMLSHWIKKLAKNGKLIVIDIDLYDVCRSYTAKQINTDIANLLLHGAQKKNWDYKKVNVSSEDICSYLEEAGLKIKQIRISNGKFIITAEKV